MGTKESEYARMWPRPRRVQIRFGYAFYRGVGLAIAAMTCLWAIRMQRTMLHVVDMRTTADDWRWILLAACWCFAFVLGQLDRIRDRRSLIGGSFATAQIRRLERRSLSGGRRTVELIYTIDGVQIRGDYALPALASLKRFQPGMTIDVFVDPANPKRPVIPDFSWYRVA